MQGSHLDAKQATKAIKLIQQQERAFGKKIPYAILFSRTSEAIRPRTLQHIKAEFAKHGVPAFTAHMHERDAFKAIFSFGGTLENLNPKLVRNLDGAISNARALAAEVIDLLRPRRRNRPKRKRRDDNGKGGVMAEERASIFVDDDELDVSAFKPKPAAKLVDVRRRSSR